MGYDDHNCRNTQKLVHSYPQFGWVIRLASSFPKNLHRFRQRALPHRNELGVMKLDLYHAVAEKDT